MFSHPVSEGEGFTVWFIHSVNQSPVSEIFTARQARVSEATRAPEADNDFRIVLTALEFEDFGAGMPTEIQPGQTLTHLPCGTMRIENIETELPELRYMIGRATDFVLYVGRERVPLNELAEPGVIMEFSIRGHL
ncbi:MAG: DUF1850 domain-containing protein [Defluviitaleaceae bacterium]|nr:DUF1850 domain-containing protein [Defluviitaleaceae bacterium]